MVLFNKSNIRLNTPIINFKNDFVFISMYSPTSQTFYLQAFFVFLEMVVSGPFDRNKLTVPPNTTPKATPIVTFRTMKYYSKYT